MIRQRLLESAWKPVSAARARHLAGSLRSDGSWPDLDYLDQTSSAWATFGHLQRVMTLVQACKSPGSELQGDARIRTAALASLNCWLERDFRNPNWWWNEIGVPQTMVRILLALEDELSPDQRQRGLRILERARIGLTGQNLVWVTEITAARGILQGDRVLVGQAYRRIADGIRVTVGEGIQPDFSFHQHGACLYSHGYGAAFAIDCSRIAAHVAGTGVAFARETLATLTHLALDGSQWMARGSAADFGGRPRDHAQGSERQLPGPGGPKSTAAAHGA